MLGTKVKNSQRQAITSNNIFAKEHIDYKWIPSIQLDSNKWLSLICVGTWFPYLNSIMYAKAYSTTICYMPDIIFQNALNKQEA